MVQYTPFTLYSLNRLSLARSLLLDRCCPLSFTCADKERRQGRRSTILLPAPPGLEDVVEERKAKYMEWLESDEDDSSSEDESSSDE